MFAPGRFLSFQRIIITTFAALFLPEIAMAELGDYDYEPVFELGGSCATLAYTAEEHIEQLIRNADDQLLEEFCYSEEPFFCADYSSFLGGSGSIEVGEDGYLCRFVTR